MSRVDLKSMVLPAYTARLILRRHVYADWKAIFDYSRCDGYRQFLPIKAPTPRSAKRFVKSLLLNQMDATSNEFNVAVCRGDAEQLVGDVRLILTSAARREAHIGCGFSPREWGKGYASEAMTAVI